MMHTEGDHMFIEKFPEPNQKKTRFFFEKKGDV